MNPYESPRTVVRRSPLHKRLRRGIRLAWNAYWDNLRQERVTPVEHVGAWFALSLVALLTAGLAFVIVLYVLVKLGFD